ncbi:hypothetical protein Ciccas_005171 [Cichlidogyrus casuarinus]|uniref:Uncharacterized protein n=1 Tax=Cichlidogyrus casuarinus TaxID=1844966 RepID=A0ABD2QBP0_9PLAT
MRVMLEELSQQLEMAKRDLEATKKDAREAIDQASQWAKDQEQKYEQELQELRGRMGAGDGQVEGGTRSGNEMEIIKLELNDVNKALREAQKTIEVLRRDLDERNERVQILEVECFQQQAEELDRLRRELQQVTAGTNGGQSHISIQQLKQELDMLHREIGRRDETITKMNRECQENHIKKLEAAQQQLRRYEEEAGNLSRVLEEQRRGLEERDRIIKKIQADAVTAGGAPFSNNAEYERLKVEHAQCSQQLEARAKQIASLANQLESQTEEILSIKQEALTASLCEKDANIALMEITAPPNNPGTANVIEKMREERAQIQQQLKQLSTARAAMEEEKKSRATAMR